MVKTRGKITKVNGRNQKFWNCKRADKEANQEELRNLLTENQATVVEKFNEMLF